MNTGSKLCSSQTKACSYGVKNQITLADCGIQSPNGINKIFLAPINYIREICAKFYDKTLRTEFNKKTILNCNVNELFFEKENILINGNKLIACSSEKSKLEDFARELNSCCVGYIKEFVEKYEPACIFSQDNLEIIAEPIHPKEFDIPIPEEFYRPSY